MLRKLRQEDRFKFKASLSDIVSSSKPELHGETLSQNASKQTKYSDDLDLGGALRLGVGITG